MAKLEQAASRQEQTDIPTIQTAMNNTTHRIGRKVGSVMEFFGRLAERSQYVQLTHRGKLKALAGLVAISCTLNPSTNFLPPAETNPPTDLQPQLDQALRNGKKTGNFFVNHVADIATTQIHVQVPGQSGDKAERLNVEEYQVTTSGKDNNYGFFYALQNPLQIGPTTKIPVDPIKQSLPHHPELKGTAKKGVLVTLYLFASADNPGKAVPVVINVI